MFLKKLLKNFRGFDFHYVRIIICLEDVYSIEV
jgi:hypothetical protein